MHTTKKTIIDLGSNDNLEVRAGTIVVNVRMDEKETPCVTVEGSRGLSTHYYNKQTDVRQGSESSEPHLMLTVFARSII